jgi:ferrous iron transport protein A
LELSNVKEKKAGMTEQHTQRPAAGKQPAPAYRRGQKGRIEGFSSEQLAGKLMAMGVLPGTDIELLQAAPLGGGWYVRAGNLCLALRSSELDGIIMHSN